MPFRIVARRNLTFFGLPPAITVNAAKPLTSVKPLISQKNKCSPNSSHAHMRDQKHEQDQEQEGRELNSQLLLVKNREFAEF